MADRKDDPRVVAWGIVARWLDSEDQAWVMWQTWLKENKKRG